MRCRAWRRRSSSVGVRDSLPAAARHARPVKGESTNLMACLNSGPRKDPGRRDWERDDRDSRTQCASAHATDTPLPCFGVPGGARLLASTARGSL